MQRIVSAPRSTTAQPNNENTTNEERTTSSNAGEIWKVNDLTIVSIICELQLTELVEVLIIMQDRAHKLAKLVYDLEIQKLDLQKRLKMAETLHAENPNAADVQALHNELLELKAKLEQEEEALKNRDEMLKVAAGVLSFLLFFFNCFFL